MTESSSLIKKAMGAVKLGKKSSHPRLIVLMGLPGSGKSYLAQHLTNKYGFTRLSGENITYALFGSDKCSSEQYAQAYKTLRLIAAKLLVEGYSIIIDGTNLKRMFRDQIYQDVPHRHTILVYLIVDMTTAMARIERRNKGTTDITNVGSDCSEETFREFMSQLEEPQPDEHSYSVVSDDNLFSQIDAIINNQG